MCSEQYAPWLDRARSEPGDGLGLVDDHLGRELEGYEVTERVNHVRSEGPELTELVEALVEAPVNKGGVT